jgi:PAS domain S-box-containing protein
MARFRDFSIRRKLLFINVLTTSTALGLASTAFIGYERLRFEADIDRQLSTVADVIGASARSALAGHDKAGAEEMLRGLAAEPRILAACLYDANGGRSACYAQPGADRASPLSPRPSGVRSESGDLVLTRPIPGRDRPFGFVWIRFDGRVPLETLRHELAMVSVAMSVCFIIAVLLSTKLQRVITAPLMRLAQTAREVAAGRDYSLRAQKSGEDELGRLVDSFNGMLSQLGEHAAELRSIYESAHDAIVTVTTDGDITSWNKGAEHIFGVAEAEVRGTPVAPFLTTASLESYRDELRSVPQASSAHGNGKLIELTGRRRDGTEFPLELTLATWRTKEGAFFTSFMRDTSARRMLEAQLAQAQKLESIGHLAAGVAHEINTPIQYVSDNTRFLDESFRNLDRVLRSYETLAEAAETSGLLPEQVQQVRQTEDEADLEYLQGEIPRAIQQSGEGVERVATIVRAMKEFSHPGSAEMKAIDLNHAIESTLTVSRNEWKYVADAVTEFDPNLPAVRCLPAEFNQAILNLVVNAAHAIADVPGRGSNKGRITIRTRRDGAWAEVRICDTGTGIPEAVRARIFTPFFTTKEMGRGTGQGLAIAHTVVVTKHGGTLSFETEEGRGTTFIVRLLIEGCPPGKS